MAYSKQTWTDLTGTGLNKYSIADSGNKKVLTWNPDSVTNAGTPVTAERMNHIEDGIVAVETKADSAQTTADSAQTTANNANTNANGRVPTSRKVNGHALTEDVTIVRDDITGIVKSDTTSSKTLGMSLSGTTLTIDFA